MHFISFIVPVYNIRKEELDYCISSISKQINPNYEVIIVDDGSTAEVAKYCDELGAIYNFKVIHQKNQGLAAARNTGIAASDGEWIVHVDGDDWISEVLSQSLYEIKDIDSDIIVWGYYYCNSDYSNQKYLLNNKNKFSEPYKAIKEDIICSILGNDNSFLSLALNTSWGKAYRRSFILNNNLYYNTKLRRAQDAIYNLYAFSCAKKVTYIDKALNFYRADNLSLSRGFKPNTLEYLTATANAAKDFAMNTNTSSPRVIEGVNIFIMRCFRMINNQYFQHDNNPESYRGRRNKFLTLINSAPYKEAFAMRLYRSGMLNKISDFFFYHRLFLCIKLFDKTRDLARHVKLKLSN